MRIFQLLTALLLCARSASAFAAAEASRGFRFNLGRSRGGEAIGMCQTRSDIFQSQPVTQL